MERPRVIGYTRVSTEEQARGGLSLEAQEGKIRSYCELYELDLLRVIADPGASGKSLDRPGVAEVLAELRRRKDGPDGLVIAKLDRLTRSLGDWSDLIAEFWRDEKRRLFSVGEAIDTRTATGRMVLNLIMTIAEWEREVIGERTRDALAAKAARSERCGKIRYGYDLASDGRTLSPNPTEQAIIAAMREWRSAGMSLRRIVARLAADGIPTKDGRPRWGAMTVGRILARTGTGPAG